MSNHITEFTFTKTIFTEDNENEFDAQEKAKAYMLNLLNQIEDNQSFIKNWMKIKTTETIMKEEPILKRKYDACQNCGIDADCEIVDQKTGLCQECTTVRN